MLLEESLLQRSRESLIYGIGVVGRRQLAVSSISKLSWTTCPSELELWQLLTMLLAFVVVE